MKQSMGQQFLLGRRPKPLGLSSEDLVTFRNLRSGQRLPLLIEPAGCELDAFLWAQQNLAAIKQHLLVCGAILFRGWNLRDVQEFHSFAEVVAGDLMCYQERSSPRSQVSDRIYTSTDYPSDQCIFPHNEHSYSRTFPTKIAFWCETPPSTGGETPIADTRAVYRNIDPEVRLKFERLGWLYVRNFNNGVGLSWQTVFQTLKRIEVENYCQNSGIRWSWEPDGRLKTAQWRPAVLHHPQTLEPLWFNHIAFFHNRTLPEHVRRSLLQEYGEEDLPNNTYYGDGTRIEDNIIDHIRDVFMRDIVVFPWQEHDLLLLDNLLTAHARKAYTGERRVLVALADAYTREDFIMNGN